MPFDKKNIDFIQKIIDKAWDSPGGKFFIIGILFAIVVAIFFIYFDLKAIKNETLSSILVSVIIALILIFLILIIIGFWKSSQKSAMESGKLEVKNITSPKVSKGRYFVGVDIGRNNMKYCLIDHDNFKDNDLDKCIIAHGVKDTPKNINNPSPIYDHLCVIINELYNYKESIDGIGLGLPGQVDPQRGRLIKAPGLSLTQQINFVNGLRDNLPGKIPRDIPIKIDNDVRCATRYQWKKNPELKDLICIFVGNGLGSGVVIDGKMRYGNTFTTGEAGHTTIFDTSICEHLTPTDKEPDCNFIKNLKDEKCKCGLSGYHWEQLICSYGIETITKKCEPEEYKKLVEYCKNLENNPKLQNDTNYNKYFNKYFTKTGDITNITTYAISAAYYVGVNNYVKKIVEKIFIKYLAIGIANYINIINPENIFLGGGMVEGFLGHNNSTESILQKYIEDYSLGTPRGVVSIKPDLGKEHIASVGAALIFKDESYTY